jgi:hypothetical protein
MTLETHQARETRAGNQQRKPRRLALNSHTISKVLAVLGIIVVGVLWLGVNIFPVITNDSLAYLTHANDLPGGGFVQLGYRQVGYPAFAALARGVGDLLGGNPVLWIPLIQRMLFALAGVYLAWVWRWWALPALLLLAAPTFMVYSNQVLTEGLGIPAALFLAGVTTHAIAILQQRPQARHLSFATPLGRRVVAGLVLAAAFLAFVAVAVRYTYAALGIAPLVIAYVAWQYRRKALRLAIVGLAAFVAATGIFTVGICLDNLNDWGRFTPATRTARAEYWAAWSLVFTLHPDNVDKPELTEFYDGGTPYTFIHALDENDDLDETDAQFEQGIEDLLAAAGMSKRREQLAAFAGGLTGGRLDDFGHILTDDTRAGLKQVLKEMHRNRQSWNEGRSAVNERYNRGQPLTPVLTDAIVPDPPFPYFVTLLRPLLLFAMAVGVAGLLRRSTRGVAVGLLAPPVVMSLAAAATLADNVRFLLITSVWAIAMSGPLLRMLLDEVPRRRRAWATAHVAPE